MYFGSSNGLTAFHPDQIIDNAYIPPVVLTDLRLLNQTAPVGGDSPLQKAIWNTDEITLSHKDQVVTFDFAVLSYADPASNLYRYRLEGFEDSWSPPGHQRSATYTNLDPGEYVFRVVGSNDDGIWNEDGASLTVTVTPPWWGTWWFRGVLLLLVVGLVAGGYSWRMRSIQARSRELEHEVAAKTRDLEQEIIEREETEQRLRTTRDELAAILAVSKEIVSTLDLDPLLYLILDKAREVIGNDGAGILTLEDSAFDFRVYRGVALAADLESLSLPVAGITPIRELLNTKQAVIIDDLHQEPALPQEFQESVGCSIVELFGGTHSWMCVPMIASDQVVGMLGFIHREPGYYQPEVLILAQVFADQAAIAIENAQLYARAQETAVLEERNRLARELHDSVTQTLYSTNLFADAAHLALSANSTQEASENLDAARDLIWQAMLEMRMLLFELRPPLLEEQGLVGALQTRLETVEGRVELPIEFRVEGEGQLPPKVEAELYYVALEALNNIAKHAGAKQATVHLKLEVERCLLTIQDDGIGFDPEAARLGGGQGLLSMQERIEQIGGRMKLETAPGCGTTIKVEVNL
jgi:signal transduction histidine kinase